MNIPTEFLVPFLVAWLGVQGWTLITIVKLMNTVAALKQQLADCKEACKIVKIAEKLEKVL